MKVRDSPQSREKRLVEVISIRVPRGLADWLKSEARKKDWTVSQLIRNIIKEWRKHHG
jgi:predicted DNA-binding protein